MMMVVSVVVLMRLLLIEIRTNETNFETFGVATKRE